MFLRLVPTLLLAAGLGAVDVELALTSGRTVQGEVVSENTETITLRQSFPTRGGTRVVDTGYARNDIVKRTELPSALQRYEERKARTPDTTQEQCALMQWTYENCLRDQTKTHAVHVLELDPDNAWAKRILDASGYLFIEAENKWVDEASYLKEHSLAKLDGKLVSADYAKKRQDLANAVATRDQIAKNLEEKNAIVRDKGQDIAGNDAKAKQAEAAVAGAKQALDRAQQALTKAQTDPPPKGEAPDRRAKRLETLHQRVTDLQTKYNDLKKTTDASNRQSRLEKAQVDDAKATITKLEADLEKAKADVASAAAKLPSDDPAVAVALRGAAAPAATPTPANGDKPGDPVTSKPPAAAGGGGGTATPEKPPVRRLRQGGGD